MKKQASQINTVRWGPKQAGLYEASAEHDACGVGFVVNIDGVASHQIVEQAITVLKNLSHRGATGSEVDSGDGAGITIQLPHEFFKKELEGSEFELPEPGQYAVGQLFLPPDPFMRRRCEERFENIVNREGLVVLGWRTIHTQTAKLGNIAKATAPVVRQIFVSRSPELRTDLEFERKLFVIRKSAKKEIYNSGIGQSEFFYTCSFSHKLIVYKGMLTSEQLSEFYPDLTHPELKSALGLVHSRFSTNTFPSWARAHPYRHIAHNGEINTLKGNENWFRAREKALTSKVFGEELAKTLPIIDDNGSDSSKFDNCAEFFYLSGRPIEHAMLMMIPEPWQKDKYMDKKRRAFYEYHSCLMEPWDGPAAMTFTDGVKIGALLDRNGLRPGRYCITKDNLLILASEAGVLDIAPENILMKSKLSPGQMLLIDTKEKRIISDKEIKDKLASEKPYEEWLKNNRVHLKDQPAVAAEFSTEDMLLRQEIFGYNLEDLNQGISTMATTGQEPIGSMGNDATLAVLSDKPRPLFDYFKQLFAQVTNPPLDSIREEIVMSSGIGIGPEGNIVEPDEKSCHQVHMDSPILSNADLAKIKNLGKVGFKTAVLPITFKVAPDAEAHLVLEEALDVLCQRAADEVRAGTQVIVLSDRTVNKENAPIPSLLALGAVHHSLIKAGLRTKTGLVLESAEPREVHHVALLVGYGASGVNPYLVFETAKDLIDKGLIKDVDYEHAEKNIIKALTKGILKTASKMGISTVESYCGAQIFEAFGLGHSVVDRYFCGTSSRIDGIRLHEIAIETLGKHRQAYENKHKNLHMILMPSGQYKWRATGDRHQYDPDTIRLVQEACRTGDYSLFKQFSARINDEHDKHKTLRGLLDFRFANESKKRKSIPLEEVEPIEMIMRRFKTGAMSYGSISKEAHECLAIAMNRIHGRSNTGEGGEDPERFKLLENGDSKISAIKQVASGRFGVTSEYLVSAREIQIKIAQGAKPGEGGQLPNHKVYPWIAEVRGSTPGVELISPPPHHDIYSIEDIAQLIHDLKNANPEAKITVKLVSSYGVGTIAAGVAKAKADLVLISGYDGGTGAAPLSSIKHAGLPWELGLAETHQTLVLNDLRSRIIIETDGQLKTGRDIAIAAILGAQEFGFGTAPLVTLGCLMMRVCHLNTCPTGVATQDPELRKNFRGKPEYVINFMRFIAMEVREIMAELGISKFEDMIGRYKLLKKRKDISHWKAKHVSVSRLLFDPGIPSKVKDEFRIEQDHGYESSLHYTQILRQCRSSIRTGEKMTASFLINNTDRVVGTLLGNMITKVYGGEGLPDDTITLNFRGSAGQSFGAFIPRGLTLKLRGEANDYVGKGLSGGHLSVSPLEESKLVAHENIIIGNVAFFGATTGEAYICGRAGERFCVRNSGIHAVVEGVGDHGLEYMTGGSVVILGSIGRNIAAGMSGGVAYIYDADKKLEELYNPEMVDIEICSGEDLAFIEGRLKKHIEYTGSKRAQAFLGNWQSESKHFRKLMPRDYKNMILKQKEFLAKNMSKKEAAVAAFEALLLKE